MLYNKNTKNKLNNKIKNFLSINILKFEINININ